MNSVAYTDLKSITDRVYKHLEATGEQLKVKGEILELLLKYNISIRKDDGKLVELNVSIPKTVKNGILIGLRYKKRNNTYSEDHFLFEKSRPIFKGYRGAIEKKLKEYAGTHKLPPNV